LFVINKSIEEIINLTIQSNNELYNVNNKGYRYYKPIEFNIFSDEDYNQILISKDTKYYLYVDIISYFYKNTITLDHDINDYTYFSFGNDDNKGYIRITKDNDYFFVELCYNYAIIEVDVKESDLKYAVSRAISILTSIKYNDLIIEKYIDDNDIESNETIYKIPSPEKESNQNVLMYIDENENSVNSD
jgi:hypothetical protein